MVKTQSIKKPYHKVYRQPGSAIEGDKILVQCRKCREKMQQIKGAGKHRYYYNELRKNAYALIERTFTNLQK